MSAVGPIKTESASKDDSGDLGPRDSAIVLGVTVLIVGLIVVFLGLSPSFAGESELIADHPYTGTSTTPPIPEEFENASRK